MTLFPSVLILGVVVVHAGAGSGAGGAGAGSGAGADGVTYQRTTQMDFEGDTLEADTMKPDGSVVLAPTPTHKPLDHAQAVARIKQLEAQATLTDAARLELARLHMDEAAAAFVRLLDAEERAYKSKNAPKDVADKNAIEQTVTQEQEQAQALFLDVICAPADRARASLCALRAPAPPDDVLIDAAWTFERARNGAGARAIYGKLLEAYPSSSFAAQAHLVFGDYFFEQASWENAIAQYAEVVRAAANAKPAAAAATATAAQLAAYALYKTGWVKLNVGKSREALELFFKVIDTTRKETKGNLASLHREATKDFVLAFASAEKPQVAYATFKKVDEPQAQSMLSRLGSIYVQRGEGPKASLVFTELLAQSPDVDAACQWRESLVEAALIEGNRERIVSEMTALVAWPRDKKHRAAACEQDASIRVRELATTWHTEAKKTRNEASWKNADAMYALYLDNFGAQKEAPTMRFYRAELLYGRAEFAQAAPLYDEALASGGLDAKLVDSALDGALHARNEVVRDLERGAKPGGANGGGANGGGANGGGANAGGADNANTAALTEARTKLLAAVETYLAKAKEPRDVVELQYKRAKLYFDLGKPDVAQPILRELVEKHLDDADYVAEPALLLLIDGLPPEEAGALIDSVLARPQFATTHKELAKTLRQAKTQTKPKTKTNAKAAPK